MLDIIIMIPQIIIKNVELTTPWTKKQPKLFEDFLSKVNHLKNEVKETEHCLKKREESYKLLEKQILLTLGISEIVKASNILDFLEVCNENSPNYDLQLLENQVHNLEHEIKEVQVKKASKMLEIEEKQGKSSDFKKLKEELEVQSLQKLNLKKAIKEMQGEMHQLNYILLDRKKVLKPQEDTPFLLNDDLIMLIENLLKTFSKTESKISKRRTSLDFVESNFEKIEQLEKELELNRKNQKKIIRQYEEKITDDTDQALDNYKAKNKENLRNIEEEYQKKLDLFESEIKDLNNENVDLYNKLDELEKIALEVNRKEKELNSIKLKWDELWCMKADFERDVDEQLAKINLIPIKNKKTRKSANK